MKQMFSETPKPMIPVAGKPLLQHQIELLVGQGIADITLIIGYKAEAIRSFFGDGSSLEARIRYIVENEPLGTGGALALLPKEETLVLLGDLYLDVDLGHMIAFHREKHAEISLFVHPNSHPYDSDIVVADKDALVTAWMSKKDARPCDLRNLVNAGIYLFSSDALPSGPAVKRDLERELIMPKIPSGGVYAYRSTEYVKDMGTPERLETVTRDVASGAAAARNLKKLQRAVFIDRDGTINEEADFIIHPEQLALIPCAAKAIQALNDSMFLTICVTNQPVIARGDASFEELEAAHARLDVLLGREGAYLDDLFFCPHHPDAGFPGEVAEYKIACDCRKPKPGMLLQAAAKYNIDLSRSYMIGDRTTDIAAGRAAGCMALGVRTGTALGDGKCDVHPDAVYEDLRSAIEAILAKTRGEI